MTTFQATPRQDRLIQQRIHDPYHLTRKPSEPSLCPVCNSVFKDGRWQWLDAWPMEAKKVLCPACQRIRDNYPAGYITMSGDFIRAHREEVLNLARRHELGERIRYPLHRIISIEEHPDKVVVATTDVHLPKRIGQALRRAYKGHLDLYYDQGNCFVRANWTSAENIGKKKTRQKSSVRNPGAKKRR